MMQFIIARVENIVEKGENAGYQHFLLFSQCFQKAFSSWVSNVIIGWKRLNSRVNCNITFRISRRKHFSDFHWLPYLKLRYTSHNEVEGGIMELPWLSVCLSVDTILSGAFLLQFCTYCSEIYTYVCVHIKLCMCNFHDQTSLSLVVE